MHTTVRTLTVVAALLLPASLFAAAAKLKIGDPAPALATGEWIKGEPVKAFETGKVYVVEFWATWCPPCRQSIPHLTELQKRFPAVVIIGQNCSEQEPAKVKEFVKKMGDKMNYRVALDDTSRDAEGAMYQRWMTASGARGIPTAFLVDQTGKLAWQGHPMNLDRVLAQVVAGNFDTKREEEFAAKMDGLQKDMARAMRAEDADKALATLEEMNKLDPDGAKERELHKAYLLLALKKDYAAGQALVAKLADGQFKDDGQTLVRMAGLLVGLPEAGKVDLDLALRLAQRGAELNGVEDIMGQVVLARAYGTKGQYDKAVEVQTKVVAAVPEQFRAEAQKDLDEYQAKAKAPQP